jgi:hypothetical protein
MLNVQDPIRNALRDLVRAKRIFAWSVREAPYGAGWSVAEWTVVRMDGGTTIYTTDSVNRLIGMFWSMEKGASEEAP